MDKPRVYGWQIDKVKHEFVLYHGDGEELRFPLDYFVAAYTKDSDKAVPEGMVRYVFKSGMAHTITHEESLFGGGHLIAEPPQVKAKK